MRPHHPMLVGTSRVDAVTPQGASKQVLELARNESGGYVCCANAHVVATADTDPALRRALDDAALVTPDGMPLAWALRAQGVQGQQRVYGPDLMLDCCEQAAAEGVPVFLYGSSERTLGRLQSNLTQRFPGLQIAGAISPPFRPLSGAEIAADLQAIEDSGARIVFVGLGAPRQELWMHTHHTRLRAVLVGVGAAFDFHAGTLRQAPSWMQRAGLEWLFRLAAEPRRLWRRYLVCNSRFVLIVGRQMLRSRKPAPAAASGDNR